MRGNSAGNADVLAGSLLGATSWHAAVILLAAEVCAGGLTWWRKGRLAPVESARALRSKIPTKLKARREHLRRVPREPFR